MADIGDETAVEKLITEDLIAKFIEISGDSNPIHTSDEFASKTIFKKRIAHGLISASLISKGLTDLLGAGNVWVSQTLKFKKPVYIGDVITAKLRVLEKDKRNRFIIETTCLNQNGDVVIEGKAESILFQTKR